MTEAERVAKGAAWLDIEVPGWERKIDLSRLDLGSCYACICGQAMADMLEGYYIDGFSRALNVSGNADNYNWPKEHGFYYHDWHDMAKLEAAWTSLIKERHNTGNFSDAE